MFVNSLIGRRSGEAICEEFFGFLTQNYPK